MFKNILVPTDGSTLARKAAKHAVALAKATGGKIIAFMSRRRIRSASTRIIYHRISCCPLPTRRRRRKSRSVI